MTRIVVDASALAADVFNEEGAEHVAQKLSGAIVYAPELLRFQLASAAVKKARRHPEHAPRIMERLSGALEGPQQIRWHDVHPVDVAMLAQLTGLSAYDASYLWLAGWLDVTLDAHWPEERRRSLLAEAMELYRWRGTTYGLTRMIEVSTGLTAVITDDPIEPFVIRVRVSIPSSSGVRRDVIENLIREHKPAHVGYVLETS